LASPDFGAELGERLDELAQMGCAATGQKTLLNALAIRASRPTRSPE